MTRLQREIIARADTLGWTPARLAEHLRGTYGASTVESLSFAQLHNLEAYLKAQWQKRNDENAARTREQDAAVSPIPFIFRSGRG